MATRGVPKPATPMGRTRLPSSAWEKRIQRLSRAAAVALVALPLATSTMVSAFAAPGPYGTLRLWAGGGVALFSFAILAATTLFGGVAARALIRQGSRATANLRCVALEMASLGEVLEELLWRRSTVLAEIGEITGLGAPDSDRSQSVPTLPEEPRPFANLHRSLVHADAEELADWVEVLRTSRARMAAVLAVEPSATRLTAPLSFAASLRRSLLELLDRQANEGPETAVFAMTSPGVLRLANAFPDVTSADGGATATKKATNIRAAFQLAVAGLRIAVTDGDAQGLHRSLRTLQLLAPVCQVDWNRR